MKFYLRKEQSPIANLGCCVSNGNVLNKYPYCNIWTAFRHIRILELERSRGSDHSAKKEPFLRTFRRYLNSVRSPYGVVGKRRIPEN
ncbi:hypothetical protein CEXT_426121 [Caerostris extrusa]|uniref:Uncharacterized protein n=1 Tax=Caerostris extrusa TaxID=172846 RepID=A0AAV4QTX0_CAEEX|nr:hypothetical protein CEXT_426121 [Caerostris extrusa]